LQHAPFANFGFERTLEGERGPSREFDLSAREREILALVAAGKTNGEIAAILSISAHRSKASRAHFSETWGRDPDRSRYSRAGGSR